MSPHVPAIAKGLCQPFFTVALALLATLDSHINGSKIVLELEVDCALRGREGDFLKIFAPGDFVNLCYVLQDPGKW